MPSRLNQLARLEVLERRAEERRARQAVAQPRDERFAAAWQILLAGMTAEHAKLVIEAYEVSRTWSPKASPDDAGARLLRRCEQAVSRALYAHWPYSEIPPKVLLAMPADVAEVYIEDPSALPLHDCEHCGYAVPHQHFSSCPLCGGRVGWYAYWGRRTGQRV